MNMRGTGKAIPSILLLLLILQLSKGQEPYYSCGGNATYATNSTYQANLEGLIGNLASNAFIMENAGSFPNQIYGLVQCRGDITADDCRNSIALARTLILQNCAYKKSAVLWTVQCLLRYSNEPFFGLVDSQNEMALVSTETVDAPKVFNQLVVSLLRNLTQLATRSNQSSLMYETGAVTYTNSTTVYGLVQCTRDLSLQDCNNCLTHAVASLSQCCSDRLGARFLTGSCIVRRENYPLSGSSSSPTPLQEVNRTISPPAADGPISPAPPPTLPLSNPTGANSQPSSVPFC